MADPQAGDHEDRAGAGPADGARPADGLRQADGAEEASGARQPDRARRAASCTLCGTRADGPPLTWSLATGPRGTTWTCDTCTRTHLRAMEAKLDEEHW